MQQTNHTFQPDQKHAINQFQQQLRPNLPMAQQQ
jgi:hypothetical protein